MSMRRPQYIGTDNNGYRQLRPRTDQPCDVRSCRSNDEGGCIKMFNAGRRPENFGTPKVPGVHQVRVIPSAVAERQKHAHGGQDRAADALREHGSKGV